MSLFPKEKVGRTPTRRHLVHEKAPTGSLTSEVIASLGCVTEAHMAGRLRELRPSRLGFDVSAPAKSVLLHKASRVLILCLMIPDKICL